METALQVLEKVKIGMLDFEDLEILEASKTLATVCCFCLSEDDCVLMNHKDFKPGLFWPEIIAQLLQIDSWSIDEAMICDSCASTLKLFHKFWQKARTNFSALEQLNGLLVVAEEVTDWKSTELPVEEEELVRDEDEEKFEEASEELEVAEDKFEIAEEKMDIAEAKFEIAEEKFEAVEDEDTIYEVEYLDEDATAASEPELKRENFEGPVILQTETKRPKRHICQLCGHKVESPSKLKLHIIARHRYSSYDVWSPQPLFGSNTESTDKMLRKICDICGKSFSKGYSLVVHMRRHIGDRQFGCDVCNMKFVAAYALRRHKMTHTGEKPLACRHGCSHMFRNHSSRIRHEQSMHTNEKPYTCEICDKAFKRLQNLVTHRLIHSGAKPHTCDKCGVSFRHSHHLKTHQKIHQREPRT